MTDADVLAALDDRTALGLTGWAEARAIPMDEDSHSQIEELAAVMCVARNRVIRMGAHGVVAGYKDVCLAPKQFSCWNPGVDSNHVALMKLAHQIIEQTAPIDALVKECLFLADGVISGAILDRTNLATSYYAPAAMIPPGRVPSAAVGKPFLLIGNQHFYIA